MKFLNNMHEIDNNVLEQIKQNVEKLIDYEFVFATHESNHPDDYKSYIVLAHVKNTSYYTVWSCTADEKEANLYWGHYMLDLKTAMSVFVEKIHICGKHEE